LFDANLKDKAMIKPTTHWLSLVHSTNPPFRQIENRANKPHKHRYERRKIREIIRMSDWDDLPEAV